MCPCGTHTCTVCVRVCVRYTHAHMRAGSKSPRVRGSLAINIMVERFIEVLRRDFGEMIRVACSLAVGVCVFVCVQRVCSVCVHACVHT